MTPAEKLKTASWLRGQAAKMKRLGKLLRRAKELEAEAARLEKEAKHGSYRSHQWQQIKRKMGFNGTEEEFEELLRTTIDRRR